MRKRIFMFSFTVLLLLACIAHAQTLNTEHLVGAWKKGSPENTIVWIVTDKYFAATVYDTKANKYIGTCGGKWWLDGNTFVELHEFNTLQPEYIGKELRSDAEMKNGELQLTTNNEKETWTRVDDGTPGKLSGAWLITGRMVDGSMKPMVPGARKTMKILSGTRFQWIAYNVDTKEFFGTGGGAYTSNDGKYVEHIDFFSRDNSRAGMSLSFDFELVDGAWHHRGKSSKGDPIDEVWTRREKIAGQ